MGIINRIGLSINQSNHVDDEEGNARRAASRASARAATMSSNACLGTSKRRILCLLVVAVDGVSLSPRRRRRAAAAHEAAPRLPDEEAETTRTDQSNASRTSVGRSAAAVTFARHLSTRWSTRWTRRCRSRSWGKESSSILSLRIPMDFIENRVSLSIISQKFTEIEIRRNA